LFEIKKTAKRFARPGLIRIRIGSPVQFPPGTTPERIARELQKKVEEL
jgi:hypothetical protein